MIPFLTFEWTRRPGDGAIFPNSVRATAAQRNLAATRIRILSAQVEGKAFSRRSRPSLTLERRRTSDKGNNGGLSCW